MHIRSEQVGDAGENADRLEGAGLRRAAAAGDRRISIGADDGDAFDLCRIERQEPAVVLEQGDAFESSLEGDGPVGDRVSRIGGVELRPVRESVAQLGAEDAQKVLVDGRFLHLAAFDRGDEVFGVHELGARHLEVQAVVDRGDAVVGRIPVGHENTLESPLPFQHFQIEEIVLRRVDAVHQVVGIHDRVDVGLGHGGLEAREVDLPHGALIHIRAGVVPIELLIVEGVVLDGGDNALRLHALDEGHDKGGVQERVLGLVFEVSAAHGRARDVDAGTEQEVDPAGAGVAAEALAELPCELRIPRCRQRGAACVGGGGSPGADANRGVGHFEAGQADCRHRPGKHPVNPSQQLDLLFQRELGDHGVRLGFDCGGVGHGGLRCGEETTGPGKQPGQKERTRQRMGAIHRIFLIGQTVSHLTAECIAGGGGRAIPSPIERSRTAKRVRRAAFGSGSNETPNAAESDLSSSESMFCLM